MGGVIAINITCLAAFSQAAPTCEQNEAAPNFSEK